MNLMKLKQIICNNKSCSVENLKQLSEKLQEESTNTAVISDLPKLITAVFKYAFHEDAKYRDAAIPAFIALVSLLDLNKHLKEKAWWKEMKTVILNSINMLMPLVSSGDESWAVLWTATISLLGTDLRSELPILNKLLKVVEKAFKLNSENMRKMGFECWCRLIDNFAIDRQELNNKRRLNLLVIPLKANNHNSQALCSSKMQTWKYLLSKLDQHNELTVELVISHFLEFMFSGVANLPPACEMLKTECADMFLQLLKTPLLFRLLPDKFIKYSFICIKHVYEDVELSMNIWRSCIGHMKAAQWEDTIVTTLMTSLTNVDQTSSLIKSKTYAEMIVVLYSGNCCLPDELLIKNCKIMFGLVLNASVLVHFNESRCDELFSILAKTDPVLLPENALSDIVSTLSKLSTSESFRDNKLKLLRGIWITLTNVLCKWMSDNGEVGKDGTVQSEIHNVHQLLLFGAADLSTMWNRYHMKNWQTLYSESAKYFSLLPEASCDRFVSDLVGLLQAAVHKKVIPLHVAVDLLSIIIEFDVSKEVSNKLPLMMAIGDSGMVSLLQDISGTSFLTQFLKTVVIAARTEPSLVNDVLTVIEKMLKYLEELPAGSPHDKIRNMILKAQHQLQALKPCRAQEKVVSPVVTQSTSSPTMTSFLHRLAKAKETQAKMISPNSAHSIISSSPVRTPNSKKAVSPFADLKSEDFVFVPPKSRKTVLTDHQKESLTARKCDIPALYQDLSQDSSQSALESIVTSVQSGEDKNDDKELPEKVVDSEQKTTTLRKGLDTNQRTDTAKNKCEEILLNNKENDCVNNYSQKACVKTAISDNNDTVIISSTKSTDSIEKPIIHITRSPQAGGSVLAKLNFTSIVPGNVENMDTLAIDESTKIDDNKSVMNISNSLNVNLRKSACPTEKKTTFFVESEINKHSASDLSMNIESPGVLGTNSCQNTPHTPHEQTTPKRNLRKNRLIISIEKKSTEKTQIKTSKRTKGINNTPPLISIVKSPNGSPKVSPRRLRKRKSGVTPILSGDSSSKKKKLGLLNRSDGGTSSCTKNNSTESSILSSNIGKIDDLIDVSKANEDLLTNNCATVKCTSATDDNEVAKGALDNDVSLNTTKTVVNSDNLNVIIPEKNKDCIQEIKVSNPIMCSPVKVTLQRLEETKANKVSSFNLDEYKESSISIRNESNNPNNQHTDNNTHLIIKRGTTMNPLKSQSNNLKEVCDKGAEASTEKANVKEKLISEENHSIGNNKKRRFSCNGSEISQGKVKEESNSPMGEMLCSDKTEQTESKSVENNTENKSVISNVKQRCFVEQEKSTNVKETLLIGSCKVNVPEEKHSLSNMNQQILNKKKEETKVKSQTPAKTKNQMEHNNIINMSNDSKSKTKYGVTSLKSVVEQKKGEDNSELTKLEKNITVVKDGIALDEVSKPDNISQIHVISSPESSELKINTKTNDPQLIIKKIDSIDLKSNEECSSSKITKSERKESINTGINEGQILLSGNIKDIDVITSESTSSSLLTKKQVQENSTPSKSGQKSFKQTQLPFTPIRKSTDIIEKTTEGTPNKSQTEDFNLRSVSVEVEKMNLPEKVHRYSPIKDTNISCESVKESDLKSTVKLCNSKLDEPSGTAKEHIITDFNVRNEAPRTPEKTPLSSNKSCKNQLETSPIVVTEFLEKSRENPHAIIGESPSKDTESQDFIASSQENEASTLSLTVSEKNNSSHSCSPSKKSKKVPTKYEGVSYSQISNSSGRLLRSSPKANLSRTLGTPLKKSVCRRLDVEIDEDASEPAHCDVMKDNRINLSGTKSVLAKENIQGMKNSDNSDCSEEFLMNDIKLLNGENTVDQPNTVNSENETINAQPNSDSDNVSQSNEISKDDPPSPGSQNSLKRFLSQSSSLSIESPKRSKITLNLENTGSPKSPSSRTSHMMELAMKDKEQALSPVNISKKRRINPIKIGAVIKVQSSITQRKHRGPSEEWVRRKYSPTASPNSSILKNRSLLSTTISPDSSPPSMKKKRVSFLDPPVSASLLFSKLNPGQGQVQRPEPKLETVDCESEEVPSQGSMQLPGSPPSGDKQCVYSPLKQCSNPLTEVLERVVSHQWLSDLEEQLERLGVSTIGDLSSLTETTILRLPFIPPKIERLKKILQNYYNEINEKTISSKPESIPVEKGDTGTSEGNGANPSSLKSNAKDVMAGSDDLEIAQDISEEPIKPSSSISNVKDILGGSDDPSTSISNDKEQACISSIADKMKNYLEIHPELIQELGDRLDIDVILSILKYAVNKLKNKNDLR